MSEPEIDRRCNLCGASVRPRAAFCPQCGQQVPQQSKASDTQIDLNETLVDLTETQALVKTDETVPLIREALPDLFETKPLIAVPAAFAPPPQPKAEVQNVPAATAATPKSRVDKIRKASSVVIDQAAYDPSLRFILVAFAFFLLFLFLLIMSKVLG